MNDTIRHLIWCISLAGVIIFFFITAQVLVMYFVALVS